MKTELLDAYLTGDLRGESAAFIEAALKSDAALREVYFQQVRMDATLKVLLEDEELSEVSPDQFARGVMATLQSEDSEGRIEPDRQLAKSVLLEILEEKDLKPRQPGWWEFAKAAAITAAAAAVAILLFQQVNLSDSASDRSSGAKVENRFVAQITSEQEGIVWGEPAPLTPTTEETDGSALPVLNEDGWVRPGRFTLKSGIAEITFNSGARVFLEGPAVLDVERPDRAFLQSGRLTAEVPRPASGFVINTPRVNVVDIGTRFGVAVEDNGDTEVHVMQGIVEVSRLTGYGAPMVVEEGLAVRADNRTRSELQVIEYGGDQFSLRVENPSEEPSPSLRFVHYSFDESGGSEIEDLGMGIEGGPFDASIFPDSTLPPRPQRAVGRKSGGLSFEHGERFDSPLLSGFEAGDPLTVGLWVRIPPRPETSGSHAILELVPANHPSVDALDSAVTAGWRLGWNSHSDDGLAGSLRVENGDAFIVGSTDLRDGRWHHVGFRFVGGPTPTLGSHLHLYVDGQLEDVSGLRDGELILEASQRLQAGGTTGEAGFEGMIDEIYLFPESVTPNVLQSLASGVKLR